MRISLHLLVSISVLFICQAGPNDTALTPFIEKSAPLARLSTAIAIQNGIYDHNSIIDVVISEFFDVSPSLIADILKMDFKSLLGLLQNYPKALDRISMKVKNADGLVDALNLLYAMKKHENFLKPGALGDQTKHFEKTKTVMEDAILNGTKIVDTKDLNQSLALLRVIVDSEGANVTHAERTQMLLNLRKSLTETNEQLEDMGNYEKDLKDYLNLKSLPDELNDFVELARMAGEYSTTFQQIDSHRTDLKEASKDSDKITAAMNELQKHAKGETVSSTSILNGTFPKHPGKILTSGLLNPKNLESVFSDLQSPWLREEVLDNRDVKPLVNGLASLKLFLAEFHALQIQWKSVTDNQTSRTTTMDLVNSITEVSESGIKMLKVSSVASPFTDISNCIQSLKPIQRALDPTMLTEIVSFAKNVVKELSAFKSVMVEITKNDLKSLVNITTSMIKSLKVNAKKDSSTLTLWQTIQNSTTAKQMVQSYESILASLSRLPKELFLEPQIDYNVIGDVSTVFEGTNAESVIKCIQKSSIDNLVEMFKFIGLVEKMKARDTEFKIASDYITSLSKLQGSIQNMHTKVNPKKLSKEAWALKRSQFFENIRKTAEGIGKSVYCLRAVENVLKSEKSILAVVNADGNVTTMVAQMNDSGGVLYDDGFRRNLTAVIEMVKSFEKSVQSKPHGSLEDIGKVYAETGTLDSKLKIDSSFLKEIGDGLAKSSDPKMQSIAQDFKMVGGLNLDFSKYGSSLNQTPTLFGELKKAVIGFLKQKMSAEEVIQLNRLSSAINLQREMFTSKILNFLAETFEISASQLSEFLAEDLEAPRKVLEIWKTLIEKLSKFDESKFGKVERGLKVLVDMKRNQMLLRREGIDFGYFEGKDLKSFLEENLKTVLYNPSSVESFVQKSRRVIAQVPRLKLEVQKVKKLIQLATNYTQHFQKGIVTDTQNDAFILCDSLWDSLKVVKPMGTVLEASLDLINAPLDLIRYPWELRKPELEALHSFLAPIQTLSKKLGEIRAGWPVDSTRTRQTREITRLIYDISRRSRILASFEYVDSIYHREGGCVEKLAARKGNVTELLERMDWLEGVLEALMEDGALAEEPSLKAAKSKVRSLFKDHNSTIPTALEVSRIFENTNALEAVKCTQLSSLESILEVVYLLKTVSSFDPSVLEESMDYISRLSRLQKEVQSVMKTRKSEETLRILEYRGFRELKEVTSEKEAEEFEKKIREFLEKETRRKTPLRSTQRDSVSVLSFLRFYFWELLMTILMITFGVVDFFNSRHGFIQRRWIY